MTTAASILTLIAALGSALIAGLLFAFSTVVMPALAQVAPREGADVMQRINRVILNPLFLGTFLGTALATLLLLWAAAVAPSPAVRAFLLGGSFLYLVGTFSVTVVFNVPMNNVLDSLDVASDDAQQYWIRYQSRWTAWNHVRTIACTAATACYILALSLAG